MFKALKHALGLSRSSDARNVAQPPSERHAPEAHPPTEPDHFALGNAALQDGNYAEAARHYSAHAGREPQSASGYIGLGYAQLQLAHFEQAAATLQKAVALDPRSGDGFYMLGQAHLSLGEAQGALRAWARAHELAPRLEHLYCDYCLLLFNHGRAPQARALMEAGIEHFPANADFKFYLGNLLAEAGDYAGAAAAYREAVALSPDTPHLLSSYATALMQIGERNQAVDVLERAIALAPDDAAIFSNYLMCIQYGSSLTREAKYQAACDFSDRFEKPLMQEWVRHPNDDAASRRLRVGYVSGDFRNHSLANFIEPILRHHDKSRFELFCYYSYPGADETTQRIAGLADHWVTCHGMSDADLADRIRADQIDILVDLSGHTGQNRLLAFARKPAPVQMTWLGYQATTGLKAMDYRVTEASLDPIGTSEQFHSEKLLRLPSSGTFSPSPESPPVNSLPSLAGKPFTFACLNNPTKITDEALDLWSDILKRAPNARLMLGNATPPLIERLTHRFEGHGVDPARLVFRPKVGLADYLLMHHDVDLALDTFPYNGGTTTFHSAWMGVPLIALAGDTALSKVGVAIMQGVGLTQFCADSAARYVEQAVYFYEHPEELQVVRSELRGRLADLVGRLAVEVTASLENAMESCWREHCARMTSARPTAMPSP